MRISDWSSDVCSSDLLFAAQVPQVVAEHAAGDRAHHQHLEHEAHAQLAAEQVVDQRGDIADQRDGGKEQGQVGQPRSEEHTSELQSLMSNSYAVVRLKNKNRYATTTTDNSDSKP